MKKNYHIIAVISILSFFSSCILDVDCKTGKGEISSISRKTGHFENIVIKGSCNITITKGDSISLILRDYNNLLNFIETKVENNRLIVSYKKGTCIRNSKLEITATMPHLKGIEIEGSGSVKVNGSFREPEINAVISGSGDIFLNTTDTIGTLKSVINGSGTIEAFNVVCNTVNAEINGSGDINVNVLNSLKATIAGSGNVTYKGYPKTDVKIRGSGEVKQE